MRWYDKVDLGLVLEEEWAGFAASRRRLNRSEDTIFLYRRSYVEFWQWMKEHGVTEPEQVTKKKLVRWLDWMIQQKRPVSEGGRGWSQNNVRIKFVNVSPFFSWWAEEEEAENPFVKIDPPSAEVKPVPVAEVVDVQAIIKGCGGGRTPREKMLDARDEAIIRVLFDTGPRLGEMHSMCVSGWDRRYNRIAISGKTGERVLPWSANTVAAVGRYMRARAKLGIDSDAMWVDRYGRPLGKSGIYQAMKRRCVKAGLEWIYPHLLRHTFSHLFRKNGGSEGDLMYAGGWASNAMPQRYGKSAADERAQAAVQRVGVGNLL